MPDQHERYYCEGRLGMVSAGNNTSACRDCGAVVLDIQKHNEWHAFIDGIKAQLDGHGHPDRRYERIG